MDLTLLPTSDSDYGQQRTGARFTVRSANSPSYSLTRRQGVRKSRGLFDDGREIAEEVGEREKYGSLTGKDVVEDKVEDLTFAVYQARRVKGDCEENQTSGHKMSTKLNQNGSANQTIVDFTSDTNAVCNPASERRGRTDWRRHDLPGRSKSLDWRSGERSPDRDRRADMFMLSTKRGGVMAEGLTGSEGLRGRVMSSVQAYNSVGTSNSSQDSSQLIYTCHTLDRASRGKTLPSRFRSLSGHDSDFKGIATKFEPKGSQSIVERIEKLYGSAGLSKTEDSSKTRDLSKPVLSYDKETSTDLLTSPQLRSYERTAGGTFPRRFSSGDKSSLSPVQSRKSITSTQTDTSDSETSPISGRSRTPERLSRERWQGQTHGRFSEERGVRWNKWLDDVGTRSLDRARSRYTIAAQVRSTGAAGGVTAPPEPNALLEDRSASLRDLTGLRERRDRESKDQCSLNHGGENTKTGGINWTLGDRTGGLKEQGKETNTNGEATEKTESNSNSMDEEVFDSNPQKITIKTTGKKKFPEMLSVSSSASVKNKINQFEALTQRSQSSTTGSVYPRRTFSVPTRLSRGHHDGVKKSGSAKALGGLRDMWEGLKEGEQAGDKTGKKGTISGKDLGSGRSLSVDEVGLNFGRKDREWKEKDKGNTSDRDFPNYSVLKNTLEIPLNDQRWHRGFFIDETDFSKVPSPEEASKRQPYSPLSSSTVPEVPKTALSPVGDEDKTPTNTPTNSPFLSPSTQVENVLAIAGSEKESATVVTQAAHTPRQDSSPLHHPLPNLSTSNLTTSIAPDVDTACSNRKKQPVLDLNAWLDGLNTIKVWDDEDDFEDDDASTQKDDDSNYDSDSGESSVTVTSNVSQSDLRSFSVSLSDLCNFAGVDYESENDSDEWQTPGRRSASLSSDMSALSCVSVLPSEELDRLLEDVRSLGDNNLQDYDDVQVVVLHKDLGVGLGFSLAGGKDQNKPVTVHKVFHSGVAAQEGSIKEGDHVLSINGSSLCDCVHWEALRILRRARTRNLGVVVLRRGGNSSAYKGQAQTNNPGPTQSQFTETGQNVCVRLEKNSRDLGFSLKGGVDSSLENRPLTVQKIFQGGPVDKVFPGDEVLEIDGVSMTGMRRLEAWTLIRRLSPGPVDVVLRRPLKHLET